MTILVICERDRVVYSGLLSDSSVRSLVACEIETLFLSGHKMIGTSLRHWGVEVLQRVEDLNLLLRREAPSGSRPSIRGRTASHVF